MSVVCMSVCAVPFHAIFFEASHWPSDHMISLRPLIGQPPAGGEERKEEKKEGGDFLFFLLIFFVCLKAPWQPLQNCIGPTIRIGREIRCLPYAGFFGMGLA